MKPLITLTLIVTALFATPSLAQQAVDSRNLGDSLICVVPMIGTGTAKDPRRPLFVPLPGKPTEDSEIIAVSYEISDDGKVALVEIAARSRAALKEILSSTRTDVRIFERGKATREEIEQEFRKHKRDFDGTKFAEGRK